MGHWEAITFDDRGPRQCGSSADTNAIARPVNQFETRGDGVRPPTREELARTVREIRELIRPWGDGDHARLIRAVLDRNGV